jgi:hypothetical protein
MINVLAVAQIVTMHNGRMIFGNTDPWTLKKRGIFEWRVTSRGPNCKLVSL